MFFLKSTEVCQPPPLVSGPVWTCQLFSHHTHVSNFLLAPWSSSDGVMNVDKNPRITATTDLSACLSSAQLPTADGQLMVGDILWDWQVGGGGCWHSHKLHFQKSPQKKKICDLGFQQNIKPRHTFCKNYYSKVWLQWQSPGPTSLQSMK